MSVTPKMWLDLNIMHHLEEASTYKSTQTYVSIVFVTRDLDLSPFDLKINRFLGLTVKQYCVKFGDSSCIGF